MSSPVLLGSVLRGQSKAEQAYSWGDHALAGYLSNVVEDTTPQLGGNLDVNGFDITSAAAGPVAITPHGAGTLTLSTAGGALTMSGGAGGVAIATSSGNSDITISPHGTGILSVGEDLADDGSGYSMKITETDWPSLAFIRGDASSNTYICDISFGDVANNWYSGIAAKGNSATGAGQLAFWTANSWLALHGTQDKIGTKGPVLINSNSASLTGMWTHGPDVALHVLGDAGAVSGGVTPSASSTQIFAENSSWTQIGLSSTTAEGEFITAYSGADTGVWMGWYGSTNVYLPDGWECASNGNWSFYSNSAAATAVTIESDGTLITPAVEGTTTVLRLGTNNASGALALASGLDVTAVSISSAGDVTIATGRDFFVKDDMYFDSGSFLYWGANTDSSIVSYTSTGALFYNSVSGSAPQHVFRTDGTNRFIIDPDEIRALYPLKILESSSATGDTAAYGQIWVKNDTPNTLWFTDDAGTDGQVVVASSGTFSPSIQDSSFSDAEGQTYTSTGRYTQIGDVVFFWITITLNTYGSLTVADPCYIGNLPFTSAAGMEYAISVGDATSLSITGSETVTGHVEAGTTRIKLELWDVASGCGSLAVNELSTGGYLAISGSYKV